MDKIKDDNLIEILKQLRDDPEVKPREAFHTNARIRILNLVAPVSPVAVLHHLPFWTTTLGKLAVAGLPLVFAGAVLAAQISSPGQTLFPVKIASEKIALELAPTALKTAVATAIIDRRANEIKNSIVGDGPLLHTELNIYEDTVVNIKKLPDVKQIDITTHINSHAELIKEAGQKSRYDDKNKKDSGQNLEISPQKSSPKETDRPQNEINIKESPDNIVEITPTPLVTTTPTPQVKSEAEGNQTDQAQNHWWDNFYNNFTDR